MAVTEALFGLVCVCLASLAYAPPPNLHKWGYKPYNGPNTWASRYPSCGKTKQSPVALPSMKYSKNVPFIKPLQWINYELMQTEVLQNNGEYMTLRTKENEQSYNKGSIFGEDREFQLDEIQFRWSRDHTTGSEHSIAGITYPGEMTVICFDRKYKSLEEASRYPGAVIAIAIFLGVQKEDNVGYHLAELPNINGTTRPREIPDSNYLFLFPVGFEMEDLDFFVYEGSLTTPPCTEGVVWHVYKEPVRLSENQWAKLRSVVDPNGEPLHYSQRPIQPLNGRKIWRKSGNVESQSNLYDYSGYNAANEQTYGSDYSDAHYGFYDNIYGRHSHYP